MRYPSESKSDSINISDSLIEYPNTSSSATSGGVSAQDEGDESNIATISEHVLFGNDNGQNSFLYLYYSRSSGENNNEIRRPFTTEGYKVGKGMGSQPWNNLSGVRGSAGNEKRKAINKNDTPYPIYVSPEESPSHTRLKMDNFDRGGDDGRGERLDSMTTGLLEDDWDKITSVPDVHPGYLYPHRDTTQPFLVSSSSIDRGHGSKRVSINPDDKRNKWSSSSSKSRQQSSSSSTPSNNLRNNLNQFQPGNKANDKRVSTTTTGDATDQISYRNGIGAFFGTAASKQSSQNHDPTPEEMFAREMQGVKPRLATAGMIFTATLFILSCCSLLFVFPILVDPILVGFEAQFSSEPVTCRTTNFRNGSGSSECAIPSCREGCTVDLFSCIFVDVEYNKGMNISLDLNTTNSTFPATNDSTKRSGILLININGCGYPPEVTCSDFEKKYGTINTEFPCYYSQQNDSIVVPQYSRQKEIFHLTLAVSIPLGLAALSGITLYTLFKYYEYLKVILFRKYTSRKKALKRNRGRPSKIVEEDEEETTSMSELNDEIYNSEIRDSKRANGASKTGIEASTQM